MSIEALAEFRRVLTGNPELQDQLRGTADEASFVAKVVALGAAQGFCFTQDELRAEISRASVANCELSDEQMAAVSGGIDQLVSKVYGAGASPSPQVFNK